MKCPNCQAANADNYNFCGQCGAKLEKVCPWCRHSNPPHNTFCGDCGHDLSVPAEPPADTHATLQDRNAEHEKETHLTGSRAFVCPECGKEFKRAGSLGAHLYNKHILTSRYCPLVCPECHTEFKYKSRFGWHLYNVHNWQDIKKTILSAAQADTNNQQYPVADMLEDTDDEVLSIPSFSIFYKTILDLLDVSQSDRYHIWDSFESLTFANLDVQGDGWNRLRRYSIYPEDPLHSVLALSLGYIYKIWRDETSISDTIDSVVNLIGRELGRELALQADHLASDNYIFTDIQFTALDGLFISPSFIPEELVANLQQYGISHWRQISESSEHKVIQQYGVSIKALDLIYYLWSLLPWARHMVTILHSTIEQGGTWSSFEKMVEAWVSSLRVRSCTQRDIQIFMERRGWTFGESATLESVAEKHELTRERVRQIENKFIEYIEKYPKPASKPLYPLWVVIDSLLQGSSGIASISELRQQLQHHLRWQTQPSHYALGSIIEFAPKQLLAANTVNGNPDIVVSTRFTDVGCADCVHVCERLLELISEAKEIGISDATEALNMFCRTHCPAGNKVYGKYNASFVYLLLAMNKEVKQSIRQEDDRLICIGLWSQKHGSLAAALESLLKGSGRAMHFTEVVDEVRKLRPDGHSISERYTHAALTNSQNVLLWDRGTFIHREHVQFPIELLTTIESWVVSEIEQGLPFMFINRVFSTFRDECIELGVPSETALYTCLRETSNALSFPRYPQIHSGKPGTQRIPWSVIIDEYFRDAGEAVSFDEGRQYFMDELGMKSFQFEQALYSNSNIVTLSKGNYVHIDNLEFGLDTEPKRSHFDELVIYSLQCLTQTGHISVKKIFKDRVVHCRALGISSPQMLHDIFRLYASDKIDVRAYPHVELLGDKHAGERSITKEIVNYVREKVGFCTISELEQRFVENLGYSQQAVCQARNHSDVCAYLPGAIVHKDTIEWDEEKQKRLEEIAMGVYHDSLKIDQCYGTIDAISESHSLPTLPNGVLLTGSLLADLLVLDDRFRVLGNAGNAYVPATNQHDIVTFEHLVYNILKLEFNGASNLREFQDVLVDSGIIKKHLTSTMLGSCERVTIQRNEIMLTELLSGA